MIEPTNITGQRIAKLPKMKLSHRIKERIRHQKLHKVLNYVADYVPKLPNKADTKTKKLRRMLLYVKYLKELKSKYIISSLNSEKGNSDSQPSTSYNETKPQNHFNGPLKCSGFTEVSPDTKTSHRRANIVFLKTASDLVDRNQKISYASEKKDKGTENHNTFQKFIPERERVVLHERSFNCFQDNVSENSVHLDTSESRINHSNDKNLATIDSSPKNELKSAWEAKSSLAENRTAMFMKCLAAEKENSGPIKSIDMSFCKQGSFQASSQLSVESESSNLSLDSSVSSSSFQNNVEDEELHLLSEDCNGYIRSPIFQNKFGTPSPVQASNTSVHYRNLDNEEYSFNSFGLLKQEEYDENSFDSNGRQHLENYTLNGNSTSEQDLQFNVFESGESQILLPLNEWISHDKKLPGFTNANQNNGFRKNVYFVGTNEPYNNFSINSAMSHNLYPDICEFPSGTYSGKIPFKNEFPRSSCDNSVKQQASEEYKNSQEDFIQYEENFCDVSNSNMKQYEMLPPIFNNEMFGNNSFKLQDSNSRNVAFPQESVKVTPNREYGLPMFINSGCYFVPHESSIVQDYTVAGDINHSHLPNCYKMNHCGRFPSEVLTMEYLDPYLPENEISSSLNHLENPGCFATSDI